ncbi:outer membrane beta-barrel protein [uncultured Duncaniella sp.]|uniref:outer membrane beta-barrel protein n=2 Tax=uncultured Duncaniella sp. TaxID=2768039 RepID=UPI00260CEF7F|nr:outer membrane beta-barrel protein [uncultured Duncaniella sp.]
MKNFLRSMLLLLTLSFFMPFTAFSANENDSIWLSGRVRDAITKTDLTGAFVYRYDEAGKLIDSLPANKGIAFKNGERIELAVYNFPVLRKDSTIIFDVGCPGYKTQTVTYRLEKIGKRESYRNLPVTLLEKAPRQLGEVTVTASKIKFYNKGDTIVYNADAFQLAEGSMLDALISQLPGVELNEDGQIKVNGQYVESLLLNGKEFLDGNNQLMLDNIAAYTVKNVQVYEGQTKLEKWRGEPNGEKHLTMDVKLKREYNRGWIVNAQGGLGTKDRYSGRLFSSFFTPTTKLTLIANVNNLNDNRKPGKSDTWTPEMMPSGTRTYKMATFDYDYENLDETKRYRGYVTVEENSNNNLSTTDRTNFLSGGNTYDYVFARSKNKQLKLETRNYVNNFGEKTYWGGMLLGRYIKRDNSSTSLSATFDKEQEEITAKALEALYSDGSPEQLDAVINRSITRSDGSRHEGEVQVYPHFEYKIPRTNDRLTFQIGMKYKDEKEERWRDYNINYGSDPTPAVKKRQYFDNSPNHTLTLDGSVGYRINMNGVHFDVTYSYRFLNRDRDSYMYALDRMADMGNYGTLPAGYLDSFDPSNSYTSRLIENKHEITPFFIWFKSLPNRNSLTIYLRPEFSLLHQHFDYWRDNRSYLVSRNSFLTVVNKYGGRITFNMGAQGEDPRRIVYRHGLEYKYSLDVKTPDLTHLIDIVNDSDPLNIALGNPDLKNARIHRHTLEWGFKPAERQLNNLLSLWYEYTTDALVRGYTYDTSTGIRRNKTYNVDGNHVVNANNVFNLQFGNKQQFTLSSITDVSFTNYADMIGVNLEEPRKSTAKTTSMTEKLKLDWQIGKQQIGLNGSFTNRHTTSTREDFQTIDARHFSYGLLGQFRLPGGFGVNTDFTFYARRGYGVKELDTTDAIWNLRLTYTPRGGHWVFMVDGFDMLHQLSNVNYAVNASGRTVSYTNALPRYVMFSVQYRLNIQPKKR